MVYTNTGFSAHPLANPFNCRQNGNFNMVGFGYGRKSSVRLDSNATLPDSKMPRDDEWIQTPTSKFEVPNQLGPELGGSRLDTIGMAQRFPNLVVCPDGTMIDMKSGKVVLDLAKNAPAGQWAPTKNISPPQVVQAQSPGSWNDREINQFPTHQQQNSFCEPTLDDADSMRYWQQQAASSKPMSDEQKKLLADLEAGKLMKLSRLELVDESKRKNLV